MFGPASSCCGSTALLAADVHWQRINLDKTFRSEGVAAFDVNHDGKIDVVAGDVWYEAPDWKMHEIRTPGKYDRRQGLQQQLLQLRLRRERRRLGRSDLASVFPALISIWYENPKNEPGHWKEHLIWHSACNETPNFLDLTGDGKPSAHSSARNPRIRSAICRSRRTTEVDSKWTFYPVGPPGDPKKQGLGQRLAPLLSRPGRGRFQPDGRNDVLIRDGWWEAPEDRTQSPLEISSLHDGTDRQDLAAPSARTSSPKTSTATATWT